MDEYLCAVTGDAQAPFDEEVEKDELGTLPLGWTEVTFKRRSLNPLWLMINDTKQRMYQQLLAQLQQADLPPEVLEAQSADIYWQLEAQYHSILSGTPAFLVEEEVVHISDGADALEAYNEVRAELGLDPLSLPEEEEEEEEEVKAIEAETEEEG